ncbi:unnamed protein product [Rotaria magnacalcarata]|uniref:Uncharacterized protein n=1 Tax=Rotaria magnacalcarata TaxID=392030 RepID=A0A816VY91_9BILA|nr:unnamed protein product [Rotaria magnacalcarata]
MQKFQFQFLAWNWNWNWSGIGWNWKYSARNHPYYDLAHLSVHSSLTSQQDDVLLRHHNEPVADPSVVQRQSFIYLKVIISFMQYLWNRNAQRNDELLANFFNHLKNALRHALHIPDAQ